MDLGFSMDWIFIVLTLGCVFFVLQILLEYNRHAEQIRPQIQQIEDMRSRHGEEIEKVERLMEEAESEGAALDAELQKLEKKHKDLEAALEPSDENEKG
jgi:septal ring factor EnvC (AmiA/AmiB activator)